MFLYSTLNPVRGALWCMMGGVSQDTWIAVAFTAMAVTFRGGLLGAVRQEVKSRR